MTILEHVACQPISELCTEAEQRPGTIRVIIWWDQDAANGLACHMFQYGHMPSMNVLLYGCLILMLLVPPPLGDISSPFIPHYLPSSLWYVYTPNGETPPGPSKSPPSPPKSHFHTASLTVPLPYTSSHGPAPFLPSSSTPSKSPPTVSLLSSGSGTPPSNFYCYRKS